MSSTPTSVAGWLKPPGPVTVTSLLSSVAAHRAVGIGVGDGERVRRAAGNVHGARAERGRGAGVVVLDRTAGGGRAKRRPRGVAEVDRECFVRFHGVVAGNVHRHLLRERAARGERKGLVGYRRIITARRGRAVGRIDLHGDIGSRVGRKGHREDEGRGRAGVSFRMNDIGRPDRDRGQRGLVAVVTEVLAGDDLAGTQRDRVEAGGRRHRGKVDHRNRVLGHVGVTAAPGHAVTLLSHVS